MALTEQTRIKRITTTLFLLGLRGSGLVSKFMLTLFIAKVMTLEELGLYGLIAVGATIVPSMFGLGINGPASRTMVNTPRSEAVVIATTRLGITLSLHALITPLAVIAICMIWPSFDRSLIVLVAVTLLLENVASDLNNILLARFKVVFAAILLFIRTGLWPFVFMGAAWFVPEYRTITTLMEFWLGGLLFIFLLLAIAAVTRGLLKGFGFDAALARRLISQGRNFYVADMGNSGALYIDRFLVTTFLGLEATGVYTFFWSLTNAVNNLIFVGVTNPMAPKIVAAVKGGSREAVRLASHNMVKEIFLWGAGFSIVLCVSLPFMLDYLNNPKFDEHRSIFLIMMLATLLRTVSDSFDNILYAHHKDRKIAMISLAAMAVSAILISAFTQFLGLLGVAVAMLCTSLFVFSWRGQIARNLISLKSSPAAGSTC